MPDFVALFSNDFFASFHNIVHFKLHFISAYQNLQDFAILTKNFLGKIFKNFIYLPLLQNEVAGRQPEGCRFEFRSAWPHHRVLPQDNEPQIAPGMSATAGWMWGIDCKPIYCLEE